MSQILDSLPPHCSESLLCSYVNSSKKIQVIRVTNVPGWYFERVVFPGQRLLFTAPATAVMEIHSGAIASAILSDHIPCRQLRVEEEAMPESKPKPSELSKKGSGIDRTPKTFYSVVSGTV